MLCPQCRAASRIAGVSGDIPGASDEAVCPRCGAVVRLGDTVIEVRGENADEVQMVAGTLATEEAARRAASEQADANRRAAAKLRGPWASGAFYLIAAVILVGVVLAVAALTPLWAVPLIVIGAVTLLTVVGALQLRQDAKLSEKNFLQLMQLTLAQIKFLGRSAPPPPP
jgi:Flp pilus assembly protein TadB